jgi:pilus assembly protein CpaB
VSALLAGAAVGLVVTELRPPPPPTTPVLLAARPVAAGEVLAAADVRVVPVSSGAIQPGALTSVPDAVGRRVGAGLAAGEALTATRLVPRSPVDGLPPGRVALHVVAADPASVDLLAPGDAARVYPAAGGAPLAVAARVLATDPPGTSPDPLTTSAAAARGLVLSLTATEADAVLGGHGAVDGPVTVSVVAAPG